MRIAVTASGNNLEAAVDPRLGRAPFFLLVNPDTLEFEVVENREGLQAAHGAGVQAATLLARHQPAVVLTGHCGPKAFQTLQAAGIPVVVGVEGPVRIAVQDYQAGKLKPTESPNVNSHWE
jgi:predicted Fe-Mo cluster-binding NifX family protein